MAPIHHHFELQGLVGDEDHPALLDRRRDLLRDRLHDLPRRASVDREGANRDPQTGSARRSRTWSSGSRAPASRPRSPLRARGEPMIGVDRGAPERPRRARGRGRRAAPGGATACRLLERVARRRQEPGRARAGARRSPRRARAGLPVLGELELAWRLLAERVRRGHRHERQDDDGRADRAHPPRGRAARRRRRATSAPRSAASSARSSPTRRSSARPPRSSSRTRSQFAPEAAVLLNIAPDHLDRHATMDAYTRRQAPDLRAPGHAATSRCFPPPSTAQRRSRRDALSLGAAGDPRRAHPRARPDAAAGRAPGRWRGEPLLAVRELRLRGAHNVDNAMAAAAVCLARGIDPDGGARRPAQLRGRARTAWRRSRAATACCTSTTPRPRTSPARSSRSTRSRRGTVHLILGGQGKGQDFTPLREPVDAAARPCT